MEIVEETKKAKSQQEINDEYTMWCAKAGDISYKILCFQGELSFIQNKLKEINEEATELKKQKEAKQ
jgi:hypothetical protein